MSFLKPTHSFPTQLLQYTNGVDYSRHVDCNYKLDPRDRAFTILIYLDSPQKSVKNSIEGKEGNSVNNFGSGGETVFPKIKRGKVSVEPLPGRLVGFTSVNANGYCNYKSEHYSNEIQQSSGVSGGAKKMVVQKWYARVPRRKSGEMNDATVTNFLKNVLDEKMLNEKQGYVSCDGSGSCREYFKYVSMTGSKDVETGKVGGAGLNDEL